MTGSRLLVLCAAALTGCLAPPRTLHEPASRESASSDAAASVDEYSSRPQAAPELPRGPASLPALLEYARAYAPRGIVADATRFGAQAEVAAARQRAQYNPVLRLAMGTRTQSGQTGFEAAVGVEQQLEIAGERGTRIAAAQRGVEQIERERAATHWEVEVEVRRLYRLAGILTSLIEVTEQASEAARELAEATRTKSDAGDTSELAAELALARMALTQAKTASAQAEHDAILGRLAATIGWPADRPLQLGNEAGPRTPIPADTVLQKIALHHNRDRSSLRAAIEHAAAQRDQATREAWPEPSIGASYGHEAGVGTSQPADVVLGTLSVPIPSWARNQGERARTHAEQRRAQSDLLAFERGLGGQVGERAAAVRGALGRIDALSTVATTADARRLSALREAYEEGEVGVLEVLRALEQTIETRSALLAADADYVNAVAALELLLGVTIDGGVDELDVQVDRGAAP